MKFFIVFLVAVYAHLASALPSLNPDKYTVCAMTMNSTNERRIFEEQIARDPSHFNPIVELTDLGTQENWFQRACASGIHCDQLVVSGHFASGFGGSSHKRLPLSTMEGAGCSETCSGIMNHPYEVFLFGCNTMATKALDSRTPETYLAHLLEDGYGRTGAEFTVEARYGRTGDDNKTRIQRSFRGERKQIYGFDSIGPSGKHVEDMLRNYFSQHPLAENLGRLEAGRMLDRVVGLNTALAESLRITAFEQCNSHADTPEDRRICRLLNSRVSVDEKLGVIRDALTSPDWIKYVPTINEFFKAHPVSGMGPHQKAMVAELSASSVIRRQVRGLVSTTNSLVVQLEWVKFARNFHFMTPSEESGPLTATLNRMLESGLSESDTSLICSLRGELSHRYHASSDLPVNESNARALACLTHSPGPSPASAPHPSPHSSPSHHTPLTLESLGLDHLDQH